MEHDEEGWCVIHCQNIESISHSMNQKRNFIL
jgi:hypothetical protein